MKAVSCSQYGPPEVLRIIDVEKPIPKNNEVLVAIKNTAVTVGDVRIRGFQVPKSFWIPARLALGLFRPRKTILGSVFSGVVETVGKDVGAFKTGDEVFGSLGHRFGAYSEYICIPANDCIAKIPKHFSCAEAVAILWGGITALYFLKKANAHKNQNILIYGASGSVGISAVQIAKSLGANVTGVCSTSNLELVKLMGADRVIDYTTTDFTQESGRYDIIFDAVGKTSIPDTIRRLSDEGIYIHVVATPTTEIRIKRGLRNSKKKLVGGTANPTIELLKEVVQLAEQGHLKPVIDRTYRLEEMVEAHRYVDQGHKKGNVVVTVNSVLKE